MVEFMAAVAEQIKKNLGDTLNAFGGHEVAWREVGAYVFSQAVRDFDSVFGFVFGRLPGGDWACSIGSRKAQCK